MARAVLRPGPGPRFWTGNPGLEPNAGPAPRHFLRPSPPLRPRSPTPRAGRRQCPRPHRPRPGAVARGHRRTKGHAAWDGSGPRSLGSGSCEQWTGLKSPRTPRSEPGTSSTAAGGARHSHPSGPEDVEKFHGKKDKLANTSMDLEKTQLLSTSSNEDLGEETSGQELKQGIHQELASSPKIDRYKIARQLTEKAIKEKKIFAICGHYPVIRAALRRKGWVEKKFHFLPKVFSSLEERDEGVTDNKSAKVREDQEASVEKQDDIHDMMSRLVKNETPYFLWTIKRDAIDYHSLSCDQMLNHYGKTMSFTTKIGLCVNMRTLPWFVQANPDSFFPRCYSLCTEGEKQAFLDDFRRTVASSILKWVVSHQQDDRSKSRSQKEDAMPGHLGNQKDPQGTDGKLQDLPEWLLDVACRVCQAYLGQLEHEDIDVDEHDTKDLSEAEWEDLMQQYYALVQGNAFISSSGNYFSQCQDLLNQIAAVNPQTEIDGLRNIWIVKPGAKSRGRDIVCMDRVEDILELVATERPPSRDNRWVVQKYIETPMLIYDTKFDIRQWFLVTDWNPLTIWFYKESYLRFSTQRFSLDSLDSAIHLCNNSIQKHLKNDVGRSPLLPACNMWSSAQFREHLQRQGLGTVWGSLIYPSMKRAIANTMKVAQSHVEPRRNSFELYGADFILGSDFRPWLIEINSSPTMHPSTPVTAELCTRVQEDTIKVVVDRRLDRNCDTGNFELLWRQPAVELPPFSGSDLCVEGISVKRAKKLVVPTPTLSLAAPLSDVYKLKSRYSAARRDPVGRLLRAALQPSGTGQDTKVPVLPRTASPWRPELPAYYSHHANVTALKGTLTRSQATRHVAPNLTGRHRLVPMSQDRKTLPPASGPPRPPMSPCHMCHSSLSAVRRCKRCLSFCAAVLQGTSFLPHEIP